MGRQVWVSSIIWARCLQGNEKKKKKVLSLQHAQNCDALSPAWLPCRQVTGNVQSCSHRRRVHVSYCSLGINTWWSDPHPSWRWHPAQHLHPLWTAPTTIVITVTCSELTWVCLFVGCLTFQQCASVSYSKNAIGVKKASKKRPFCSYRQWNQNL